MRHRTNETPKGLVLPNAAGYGFVVGVLMAGVLLVPVASLRQGVRPLAAWVGGILSCGIFLCILLVTTDGARRWRWVGLLAVLVVVSFGARLYFSVAGQGFFLLGGLIGWGLYFGTGIAGLLVGGVLGKLFGPERDRSKTCIPTGVDRH